MVCDCVHACESVRCMCSEANWSSVSRMCTRLTAWLQPCDTKHLGLVYLSARTHTTVTNVCVCGDDASVTQLQLSSMLCVCACACLHEQV